MAQAWKCINCSYITWDPEVAGDHEVKHHGRALFSGEEYDEWGIPLHFMEDLGE